MKTDRLVWGTSALAALVLMGCGDDAPALEESETDASSSSTGNPTTGGQPSTSSETEEPGTGSGGTDAIASTGGTNPSTSTTTDTESSGSTGKHGAVCGDGVVQGDEACDDRGETQTCNLDCTVAECGDGVTNEAAGETCDDAGDSQTCDADCTVAECGDMTVNEAASETCDDGSETDVCNADCTVAECGDGVLNETAGETCDDGGESAICDTDCTQAECGDGLINASAAEECEGGPGCSDACIVTCAPFAADLFDANTTFAAAALAGTSIGMAWDGSNLYSVSGGGVSGDRAAQHGADGTVNAVFAPTLDFRSVFTRGDATEPVYARGFSDSTLSVMGAPGVFADDVTLAVAEPSLDSQSGVLWNDDSDEFVALTLGVVLRWSADGTFVGITTLQGLGDDPAELDFPSNRSLAWAQGCYLTYADGVVSSWDIDGQRVDMATLTGAGENEAAELTLSYANGEVFIGDGTDWRGFVVW
ncbi:MAG: hypothetical protein KUG77_26605 [Nannocystaceae bacterium]|nr:hypothetical protein [Nannocystaceae bacterium]